MRAGVCRSFAVLTLAVVLVLAGAAVAAEPRIALVIGNSAYAGAAALRNPVNDARAMADKLQALGFDVTAVENGTKQQMERAIGLFSRKLTAGSVNLFFYAGHGMQVSGKNYLVPVDAQIETEPTVRLEAVDVDDVLEQMNSAQGRFNIVILDACRNNPFERRFRGQSGGLAAMDAPAGSYIAYATAPGKVAADGTGGNGLYTSELLAALDLPDAKIEDVFKHVRASVMDKSGGNQTPWESSSLTGDFYFRAAGAPGAAAPAAPVAAAVMPVQATTEQLFWETIKASTDPADFRAYLAQYPNGSFAALARNRLAVLAPDKPLARGASAQIAAAAPPAPAPAPVPPVKAAVVAAPPPPPAPSPKPVVALAPLSGAFAAPKPGTRLIYSTGGGVQVTEVVGRSAAIDNLRGDPEPPVVGMFFHPGPLATYDRAAIEAIWPLEIGKRIATKVRTGGGGEFELSLHVVRTETIDVPAGRFECFVVDVEIDRGRGKWIGRFHNWFAPAVGFVVRERLEMVAGQRPAALRDWDLASVIRP